MYCVNCGKEMTEEMNVCPNCGKAKGGQPMNAVRVQQTLARYMPKDVKGWTGFLTVMSFIKLIMYVIAFTAGGAGIGKLLGSLSRYGGSSDYDYIIAIGFFLGLILGLGNIVKDMIFANIAENVATLGKNVANK